MDRHSDVAGAHRRRWRTALFVCALVASPTIAGSASARPASSSARIVFTSDRGADGSRELQVVNTLDRRRTRLTRHSPQGAAPSWSPDGHRITFTSVERTFEDVDALGLWTVNSNGTRARAVFEGGSLGFWSPDAQRLAVIVGPELWVVRRDGSHSRRLSHKAIAVDDLAWSPDGRRLAVSECRDGRLGCGISVVGVSGGRWKRITRRPTLKEIEDDVATFEPAWAPDGKRVAFVRGFLDVGTTVPILVVNADGRGEHRVAFGVEPRWAPDGGRIAYVAAYGFTGSHGIRVVRSDGTGGHSLGNAPGYEFAPAWSRDGRTVQFATTMTPNLVTANSRSHLRFFTSDAVSGKLRRLGAGGVRPRRVVGSERWSPDGRRFVTSRLAGGFSSVEAVTVFGGKRRLLVPARDTTPAWSPNGKRIAFTRHDSRGTDVLVMAANGKTVRRLASQAANPVWSPDGMRLSFERGGSIFLVDADGHGVRDLTPGRDAAWSPSGKAVLFEEAGAIWSQEVDGGAPARVSGSFPAEDECTPFADRPAWSPDGAMIAYRVSGSPTCYDEKIYVAKADGSGPIAVGSGFEDDSVPLSRPSWSPDGKSILFGNLGHIFLVRRDGTDSRMIASGDTPSWSPDGAQIVFSKNPAEPGRSRANIWVMNADGSSKTRLVAGGSNLEPKWQPTVP